MKMEVKAEEKKAYSKPETKKHKSASIVSGSGCSSYSRETNNGTYYY